MLYSQSCSNDHIYKTITRLRQPALSLPKPSLIQSLLYKTPTYQTQLATTVFAPPLPLTNEKNLPKMATANL